MTPEEYMKEIDASLDRLYSDHMATFESIMDSDKFDSVFLAMESEEKGDGILVKLMRSIESFLNSIMNKFKDLVKGSSVKDAYKNEQVALGKDPNLVVKFLNGDIQSSKEYLKKASRGEISVEEANAFVNKQNRAFEAIKGVSLPAAGIFASAAANELFLKKWRDEATSAMEDVQRADGVDYANKVANLANSDNKNQVATEASKIIVAHMNDGCKRGMDYIIGPIKSLYQKGFIKNKIMEDSEERNKTSYRVKNTIQTMKDNLAVRKGTKQLYKDKANRDKNAENVEKNREKRYREKQKLNKAVRDTFDDTKDVYVDEEAIKKK